MLEEVRLSLLEEARRSPSLLSDLAGLEQYVAESYDSRSFIELLQNADDANASRFVIQKSGKLLLVANDGRCFTRSDFESLCRSAASSKSRGSSIGYRGIGFKSVVSFARTIHLVTGDLAVTFSRERTTRDVPQAARVPLVRIPHSLESIDRTKFSAALERLQQDGLTTVFVFDDLLASGIESEFSAFDKTSLLFLRNVRHVELRTNTETVITVRRDVVDDRTRALRLTSDEGKSDWLVIEQNGVALAFSREAERIVRLTEKDAVVHAFLPTLEPSGLGIKVHADISTDPSRTRVVFDDRTVKGIGDIAGLIVSLLDGGLGLLHGTLPESSAMIEALVPYSDPRMATFQRKSFKTELFSAIQKQAKELFVGLRCRPGWLNAVDFQTLVSAAGIRSVPRHLEGIDGLLGFLRFLGAREATFDELSPSLLACRVTVPGAAEVVAHLSNRHATKQIDAKQAKPEWRLWPVGGEVLSLLDAKELGRPLDREFADLVSEKIGVANELGRLIAAMSDAPIATTLLPESSESRMGQSTEKVDSAATPLSQDAGLQIQHLSLKRWRGAEQQVLTLLAAQGWKVEDVSRQNVGYDIEGQEPEGDEAFIEVKSIDYAGQPFTLTSNEEAVARQKGAKYLLAIVRQTDRCLEVAFIRDPIQHLKLTRQCRQWVWECADYSFTPQRFALE